MDKNVLKCTLNDAMSFYNDYKVITPYNDYKVITPYLPPVQTAWDFWQREYYPVIVKEYPVYLQDKAKDKGKQAFEIIKILKDKKLVNLAKVGDFIDLMDELIKIL